MQALPLPSSHLPLGSGFASASAISANALITSEPIALLGKPGERFALRVGGEGSPQLSINSGSWATSGNAETGDKVKIRITSGAAGSVRTAWINSRDRKVLFCVTIPTAANAFLTSLSAFWELSEASGNRADSHGSNTGTDTGSVGSTSDATFGTVAVLSGSNYLSVADASAMEPGAAFSFSMWIKQTSSVAASRCVFAKWDGGGGPILHTAGSGDELKMFYTGSGGDYCITSGLGMVADTWYHAVVVYDGAGSTNADRMKIYVDGVQETLSFSGSATPTSFSNNSTAFTIGVWPTLSYYWAGRLFRGSFWQRVLTDAEVAALYNSGAGVAYGDYA